VRACFFLTPAAIAGFLFVSGCASEPFGYADDRCVGSYNQCASSCAQIGDGPARAACEDRCYSSETRCYGAGDEGTALSVGRSIGEARSERQKQEDYERWKAARDKEKQDAESAAEEASE